ncbi:signal peptidase I [Arthrobacter sp. LAPM80]|uniref:signal peptidase I n=1 Tax=Arthrobacter sp. LAPM80 TaxID=3141788 RepID=UPI00398AAFE5
MSVISHAKASVERTSAATAPERRPGGMLRTVGRAMAYVLLLIAALVALVMIVVPMATGSHTYTVLTNSMAPKYAPGTFLVVKPTPFAQLKVGDIITYQIESGKAGVISHRITAVAATQSGARVLTTQGDNNSLADANPVQEMQVQGKLFYAVPYVGFVANAVGQYRDSFVPILAAGFIGFGALGMVKGSMEKKRARQSARRSQ